METTEEAEPDHDQADDAEQADDHQQRGGDGAGAHDTQPGRPSPLAAGLGRARSATGPHRCRVVDGAGVITALPRAAAPSGGSQPDACATVSPMGRLQVVEAYVNFATVRKSA